MLTKEITKMFQRCEKNLKILQGFHSSDDNDRKVGPGRQCYPPIYLQLSPLLEQDSSLVHLAASFAI